MDKGGSKLEERQQETMVAGQTAMATNINRTIAAVTESTKLEVQILVQIIKMTVSIGGVSFES